jgi:signal transduction histidine kinase
MALVLWILIPIVLIISTVLGYILTGSSFKFVTNISNAASTMGIHDLSFRLTLPKPQDEIYHLCSTFNGMLTRLEDAVKKLRRFAGDVSHELRTPLAVLRGEAELALRKERSNEDYKEALLKCSKESVHMTHIIEDLLLFTRVESKSIKLTWQKTNAYEWGKELISHVQQEFDKRGVQLQFHHKLDSFWCSPNYLFLSLKNILINAAKHSSKNDIVIFEISESKNKYCSLKVIDQGEGIAESELQNIFDPFYRADTARNRQTGGAGIGLSLALSLVNLHNGKIEVTSKISEGTTFEVLIPLNGKTPCG